MSITKPTYTEQVKIFSDQLAASEAKRASDHAEVMAAIAALKPVSQDPPAEDPPAEDPPVDTAPVVFSVDISDLDSVGKTRTVTAPSPNLVAALVNFIGYPDYWKAVRSSDGQIKVTEQHGTGANVVLVGFVGYTLAPPAYTPLADIPLDTAPPSTGGGTTEPPVQVTGNFVIPQRTGALPAVINTPVSLVDRRLMLPFGQARNPKTYPLYARGTYAGVGLTAYMGTTGERQEIGLVTDAQAMWLAGGSPNNMLVQAEAHADVPVHFGKVDLTVTPNATCYDDSRVGSPWFDKSGYSVTPEAAHYPSLSYVPALATEDIFYLGELQAAATYVLIQGPPAYRFDLKDGAGQTRAFAWMIRELAYAFLATREFEKKGPLPDGFLPSSYWKIWLDKFRDLFTQNWVQNTRPVVQNTHAAICVENGNIDPWMQDYLGVVLGFLVWAGFEDWRPNYGWHAQQAILRAAFGAQGIGYKWFPDDTHQDYASLIAKNGSVDDANYKASFRADLKIQVLNGVAGAGGPFAVADGLASSYIPWRYGV